MKPIAYRLAGGTLGDALHIHWVETEIEVYLGSIAAGPFGLVMELLTEEIMKRDDRSATLNQC